MRYDAALALPSDHLPISIHINYHPEKEQRMRSVVAYYFDAQRGAGAAPTPDPDPSPD
tara:strand:- start:223 stop:396 length:174 start_codon:yes stop_codon:yes gene_type:complete